MEILLLCIVTTSKGFDAVQYLYSTSQRSKQQQILLVLYQIRHFDNGRLLHSGQVCETRLTKERPADVRFVLARGLECLSVSRKVQWCEVGAVAWGAVFAVVALAAKRKGEQDGVARFELGHAWADFFHITSPWKREGERESVLSIHELG